MEEILILLVAWSVNLTGYDEPKHLPHVVYQPHEFFVEEACGGASRCPVLGWYQGYGILYIDDRVKLTTSNNTVRGLIVHEIVHYLQDKSGKYNDTSCKDSVLREREAYYVQSQYLLATGASFYNRPVPHMTCNYESK